MKSLITMLLVLIASIAYANPQDEGNKIPIEVPRDREGNYEPQLIRKGVRRFANFDEKVICLLYTSPSPRDS